MIKIKSGYILRNMAGEWLVVPINRPVLDFNEIIRVSETGAFFWKMMETGAEREQMIDALLGEYDIDRQTAEQDLDSFLSELTEKGILAG